MTGGEQLLIGVYGKVPSQPDFLRGNAGEWAQAGFDRWFQDAVETLRAEGTALPESGAGFLLAPAGGGAAFVGAFAPSTDAAGRSFPLVVFAPIDARALPDTFPRVVLNHEAFVSAAGGLLGAASAVPGAMLIGEAQELAPTLPSSPDGGGMNIVLGNESAQPLLQAVGGAPAALGYALRTFALACDQAAKAGPAGRGVITVDAPAPDAAARALWLELARRRLRWRDAAPSLLWTEAPAGRLLVTLGQPTPAALSYLANPRHRAPRFWPLRTDVASAVDQAVKALLPEQRRLVENPRASLGELVAAFG
ncbi:MAG TPA: type VI secretion system-associated protein TagF [Polyangia bacterium]|nr:type VI secretion system-associated protein TagF [Polyangia bacterium]